MIIRTSMANRDVRTKPSHPQKLSDRELKRLENTKHSEGKVPAVKEIPIPEEEVKVESVIKEEVPVRDTVIIEKKEVEDAAGDPTIAEPGTAVVRSKVLEELEAEKPKKKYKIVSLGDKK